jgi:hypothetical protein
VYLYLGGYSVLVFKWHGTIKSESVSELVLYGLAHEKFAV